MRNILSLSYQDLPHYLKTCFLYLSICPKDYKIRMKSLMRRWIAEGFVSKKHGLSAEELAESYLYELVNRSTVLPVDNIITGEIKSTHVHDMVQEIIVSKALEESFVSLTGSEYNLIHDKIRRLSVHCVGEENLVPSININLAHIRSLTIFDNSKEWVKSKHLRLVRLLHLEGNKKIRNGDLKYLCKMFQLKYLSLKGTFITQLPPKIRKLQNLETLDIRETGVMELPSDIVKCMEELLFVEEVFPSLRVFEFEDFIIPALKFRETAAPKLERLVITVMAEIKTFSGLEPPKSQGSCYQDSKIW
jgi:disease resistance protein RPM1